MKFQSTAASCGPAALRNALLARGVTRSEDELAALSGYTPAEGTPPRGLLRAIQAIATDHPELQPVLIKERRPDVAMLRLIHAHREGLAAILSVDSDTHWVVSFGMLGNRVLHVADSADTEMVLHYTPVQLLERWKGLGRDPYYAIVI